MGKVGAYLLVGICGALMAATVPAAAAAETVYVDCSAASPGDGSQATPLNASAAANGSSPLGPGDRLLFRRGTTCEGSVVVEAAGTDADPTTVGAWGSGSKPRIVGDSTQALLIQASSNLVVEDLDLANPGAGTLLGAEDNANRSGIRLQATPGNGRNLTLRGLDVHDVFGNLQKGAGGSHGIVTGAAAGARYENLLIEDNTITDVSRSAIAVYGGAPSPPPSATQPWPAASTGVVIRRNRIDRIAGDGIVPHETDGAIVEDNVVSNGNLAGRRIGHPDGEVCNAGIWAFDAINTVIRRNEVFGMRQGCDGTGFDIDYMQDGTIIEQNYSHDNEGGFILLCDEDPALGRRAEVRFNLSVNDGSIINYGPCAGHFGDLSGIRFFNNTLVATTPNVSMQRVAQNQIFQAGDFAFFNNLIYATTSQGTHLPCGDHCEQNLFFNLPRSGTGAVAGDPLLPGPLDGGTGRLAVGEHFRPRLGSPVWGAGLPLSETGLTDFFGRAVESGAPVAIGFDQAEPIGPQPKTQACRKATKAAAKAKRRLRKAVKARRGLLRRGAPKPRVRKATRLVKRLRKQQLRLVRKRTRSCR